MAETTAISWCDGTFNPVLGCDPVHTGCKNCYARAYFKRFGLVGKRRRTSDANWRKPVLWGNRDSGRRVGYGHAWLARLARHVTKERLH